VFGRTFAASVWASLILAFVAFAIVMWGLAKLPDEPQESARYRNFVGMLQTLMAIFLNVSVNRMPSKTFIRLCFFLWIWSSFALTTVFQIYFTSFLVDPGHKKQVSDVEELLASNLILTFDIGYNDLFIGTDERAKLILSRHVTCPDFGACARRTATVGDAATILDFERFGIFKHKFVDDDGGGSLLCRLPDKISGYEITMYMQKGNPLFRPVNDVILRLLEAGLVDFWWSMVVYLQKFSTEKEEGVVAPITFFVFSLSHLYVAFTFLALGCCISGVVFILEIVYKNCVGITKSVASSAQ
jgi:FtsH-binding integral membrane protein